MRATANGTISQGTIAGRAGRAGVHSMCMWCISACLSARRDATALQGVCTVCDANERIGRRKVGLCHKSRWNEDAPRKPHKIAYAKRSEKC